MTSIRQGYPRTLRRRQDRSQKGRVAKEASLKGFRGQIEDVKYIQEDGCHLALCIPFIYVSQNYGISLYNPYTGSTFAPGDKQPAIPIESYKKSDLSKIQCS